MPLPVSDYFTCPSCGYGIIPVTGGADARFLCRPCERKARQTEIDQHNDDADREEASLQQ